MQRSERDETMTAISDNHAALIAAMEGIPLACAGNIGYTMGGTRWLHVGKSWHYDGMPASMGAGCNVTLVAAPETGMPPEVFAKLWRAAVRDLMRRAKCVRVRVVNCDDKED